MKIGIPKEIKIKEYFVTEQAVAIAHQMEYHELKSIIDNCPEFGGTV